MLSLGRKWLMHIDQLTLKNFRNFESVDIPLNSKMNIVIGNKKFSAHGCINCC